MARQQWKICATSPEPGDLHWEAHVFVRDCFPDGTFGQWHHVIARRKWDDSMMPTRGHALKRLLRCLA